MQPREGFSLVDMLVAISVMAILVATAVPSLVNVADSMKLGQAQRDVNVELNQARLRAVSANRPIRVRFNCPTAGYYRRVELIGSVNNPDTGDDSDSAGANRCALSHYPYPAADKDPLTRPNNDGPLQQLNSKVTFTSVQTLEFWPNGTVHVAPGAPAAQPWPQLSSAAPANIVITQGATTRSISVNTLGKIQIQ